MTFRIAYKIYIYSCQVLFFWLNFLIMNTFVPIFVLIAAMIIWSSSFIALKIAFIAYSPLSAIWLRMFLATLMFALIFRFIPKGRYEKGDIRLLLAMSFMEPCLYFMCEAYALTFTSAGQAGMITAMLPLFVAVAAFLFLGEKVGVLQLVGLVLALVGVVIITLKGQQDSVNASRPVLGNSLEVLAMCWATGYTILVKKLSARYHPLFLIGVQSTVGMVFFAPAFFFSIDGFFSHFFTFSTAAIAYLGIVVTVGGYGLYTYGISRLPASQASAYTNLIPVFTVLMSWAFLGEQFTRSQIGGAVLVFLGIYLSKMNKSLS